MRSNLCIPAVCVLLVCLLGAAEAGQAEVALHYSTYQAEKFGYLPGSFDRAFATAGSTIKAAGHEWQRIDSKQVEAGALLARGVKVLVISYTSATSRKEAAAIAEFVKHGGKLFLVYSSCREEFRDGKFEDTGHCLFAKAIGMDYGGSGSGCGFLKAEAHGHPLLRLLSPFVVNPHGYSVCMQPLAGTQVVATWRKSDLATPRFGTKSNGAILASKSAVYFAGWLWQFAEARIFVRNALDFLLGRAEPERDVTWARVTEAPRVARGINLRYVASPELDADAVGWDIAREGHGILRPTCLVVYPHGQPQSYYAAKRVSRVLSAPLVSDFEVIRRRPGKDYDLVLVGRIARDRCENLAASVQRGVLGLLAEYAKAKGKAILRAAPEADPKASKRVLVVGGTDEASVNRAELVLHRSVTFDPGEAEGRLLLWQAEVAFSDLVYPWTPVREPLRELKLTAAVNQRAKTQFVITLSMSRNPLRLTVAPPTLAGPQGKIASDRIKLLATRAITSNITKVREPEPLVPEPDVTLGPAAHQQMWLIVDTSDAAPGDYRGTIRITDEEGRERAALAVSLTVLPITLARRNRHGLLCLVWDYRISKHMHGAMSGFGAGRGMPARDRLTFMKWDEHYQDHFRKHWKAYVRDLADHGINVMFLSTNVSLPQYQRGGAVVDEDVAGRLVRYGREQGFRLFVFTQILGQSSASFANTDDITDDGSPIFSPKWDEAYKQIIRGYIAFARRAGLGFEQWAVYPYDEPHTEHARKVVTHTRKLIDAVEPRVQIWCDPTSCKIEGLSTADYWRSMADSIDIWWPAASNIAKGTERHALLRGLGKPFGFYRCGAYTTKNRRSVRPDRYYRTFGWEVVDKDAHGIGFWTWNAWLGDSWDDGDISIRPADGGVVYEGRAGPVTGINWEAWSEGLDDYKHLAVLRHAIAERRKAKGKDDPLCAQAQKTLDEAVEAALKNPRDADRQRARIRDAILTLTR